MHHIYRFCYDIEVGTRVTFFAFTNVNINKCVNLTKDNIIATYSGRMV